MSDILKAIREEVLWQAVRIPWAIDSHFRHGGGETEIQRRERAESVSLHERQQHAMRGAQHD